MPEAYTLGQLQTVVAAITGQRAHKQNFRRFISQQNLVEETGGTSHATGGRPARMYRFRREVLLERHIAGTHVPLIKSRSSSGPPASVRAFDSPLGRFRAPCWAGFGRPAAPTS